MSAVLLLPAALAQLTLVGRLDPAWPEPNLVLALVVARAWLWGGRSGMVWGLAGGFLLDLGATGPLGLHALAMLAAAYAAGTLAAAFENGSAPLAALAGAVGATVCSAIILAAAGVLGLASPSPAAMALAAAGAAASAALCPLAVIALRGPARRQEVAGRW